MLQPDKKTNIMEMIWKKRGSILLQKKYLMELFEKHCKG